MLFRSTAGAATAFLHRIELELYMPVCFCIECNAIPQYFSTKYHLPHHMLIPKCMLMSCPSWNHLNHMLLHLCILTVHPRLYLIEIIPASHMCDVWLKQTAPPVSSTTLEKDPEKRKFPPCSPHFVCYRYSQLPAGCATGLHGKPGEPSGGPRGGQVWTVHIA